jgi:predicted RNA-binding protein with RPS1 domain
MSEIDKSLFAKDINDILYKIKESVCMKVMNFEERILLDEELFSHEKLC